MSSLVSSLLRAVITVGLLAGITHLLHRKWFEPSEGDAPSEPAASTIPTIPTPHPVASLPKAPTVPHPTPGAAPRQQAAPVKAKQQESAYLQARAHLMELTERKDVEGLQAFVAKHQANREMSDWVYAAKDRIPLFEHEREQAVIQTIPRRLSEGFGRRDMAHIRRLIPGMTDSEASAIGGLFDTCKSVELEWGRGGVYLQQGKTEAEINQELEVRVITNEGEALRARRNWVKLEVEKTGGGWVVRRARWHRGGKGNFSAFAMPELP
ncbi:MAG: hypothetical protein JNK48_32010 [Bryobacterales bacterium]|nr:hypothetical protein [Bryobacterales bacterium]